MTAVHESLSLPSLARVPELILDPRAHIPEISATYSRLRIACGGGRRLLASAKERMTVDTDGRVAHYAALRGLTQTQACYALLLAMAITLNLTLHALLQASLTLEEELGSLCNEVENLAQQTSQYRPLGSSYMPLCVVPAWVATTDHVQREYFERLLRDYDSDFAIARWAAVAINAQKRFERLGSVQLASTKTGIVADHAHRNTLANQKCQDHDHRGCCIQ